MRRSLAAMLVGLGLLGVSAFAADFTLPVKVANGKYITDIGWSPAGVLAISFASSYDQGTNYRDEIIDLVEDKVIFDDSYRSPQPGEDESHSRGNYEALLKQYAIVQQKGGTLFQDAGFSYGGSAYTTILTKSLDDRSSGSFSLGLKRDSGSKTVATQATTQFTYDVALFGCFLSPYEPRCAIVVCELLGPFEDETSYRYDTFGANLKVGFH